MPADQTPQRSKRLWSNLGLRIVSGVVLGALAVGAVWFGGWAFLLTLAAAGALLSVEWGAISTPRAPIRIAATVMIAVLVAVFFAHFRHYELAWILLAIGALVAGAIGWSVSDRPIEAAFGVLYIGAPLLALDWLRMQPHGISWTIMLFAVTWSADVSAYLVGNVVKGPKLAPQLSPNKTWSGFLGGLAGAMIAATVVAALSTAKLTLPEAAILRSGAAVGAAGGLATMAGDLWESWLKRRFGVKDSGDLIPGHGGLLDRVDGLMFAVLAVAAARLVLHAGWAH